VRKVIKLWKCKVLSKLTVLLAAYFSGSDC
jgi:hypothetical protein